MPSKRYPEAGLMIEPKELVEHATLAVMKNAAAGPPELASWLNAAVRKEPLKIHDINGLPLFYDFEVARGKEVLGNVRVAASQVIGTALVAVELGPRLWNYDKAVKKLTPRVKREFARARIAAPKLVCYSYPKLGVMFEVLEGNKTSLAIYDVSSLARVPGKPEQPDSEGFYAWSFYDSLSDRPIPRPAGSTREGDGQAITPARGGLPETRRTPARRPAAGATTSRRAPAAAQAPIRATPAPGCPR